MSRTAVLVSGGVDSSLALSLAVEAARAAAPTGEGEVFALTMRHLPEELVGDRVGSCCSPRQIALARRLANRLNVPHFVLDMREDFHAHVMQPTGAGLAAGETPNPCVLCNERVKLGRLVEEALALGAETIVTGHYARLAPPLVPGGPPRIRRAADPARDQSYFLYRLAGEVRRRLRFPLGDFTKDETRAAAAARGIPAANEPDSNGVCFAPGGDFRAALAAEFPEAFESGPVFVGPSPAGRHAGLATLTVGKRRGVGAVDSRAAAGRRLYVREITGRAAVLAERSELEVQEIAVADWTLEGGVELPGRFLCQVRARTAARPATIEPDGAHLRVRFDEPVFAPAPGQAAVLYDGDVIVGGGRIVRARRDG